MTKDGRPSRINDIRYFSGSPNTYLTGQEEAVAFGRRLAWFLHGEDFSLGAYPALYLFFTPSLEPGTVLVTERGGDWWQRYTHVGVSPNFPNAADSSKTITDGTIAALLAIRPDQSDLIRHAGRLVRQHGAGLRFLLKRSETKKRLVEVSFGIGVWPHPSHLFVSRKDKVTGAYTEAEPIKLRFYNEAFDLVGGITATDAETIIRPNPSFRGLMTSAEYGGPFVLSSSAFETTASQPIVSKMVRRRG